jgi:4-hydroxy-3-polyprenylbenzoate decarboxylase
VYPATIVGIPPQEDAFMGKATERIFLTPIRKLMCPEIIDMNMPPKGVFHNVVLISIRKEYEGQAVKVMNALWGAGQMMFNKFMLVLPEYINIQDPLSVIRCIANNVDPGRDLYFTKGPADVLDHSSRTFAFSGKLGIDATIPGVYQAFDEDGIQQKIINLHDSVTGVKSHVAGYGIPLLIITVKKTEKHLIQFLHRLMVRSGLVTSYKFAIYIDVEADELTPADIVWLAANHADPKTDCVLESHNGHFMLGIDATVKTDLHDDFHRSWPNPTVMSDSVISAIDHNWEKLGLGTFIESPSLRYKKLMKGTGAFSE